MLHYLANTEIFDKPFLLAKDAVPIEVMDEVFTDYSLVEQRILLWKLIHAALVTDNEEFKEPSDRDALLHQCSRLEELIEACWLLNADNQLANEHSK